MGDAPDPPPDAAPPGDKLPDSPPDALPGAPAAPPAPLVPPGGAPPASPGSVPPAPPGGAPPAPPGGAPPAPPGGATPAPPGGATPVTYNRDAHYLPIIIMTGLFGALFIVLPLLIRKGPNRGMIRCCIMLSLFCIWILWVTIYISQMNPIMGPRMHNTTIAWLAYKFGNPIKRPTIPAEGEQPETF